MLCLTRRRSHEVQMEAIATPPTEETFREIRFPSKALLSELLSEEPEIVASAPYYCALHRANAATERGLSRIEPAVAGVWNSCGTRGSPRLANGAVDGPLALLQSGIDSGKCVAPVADIPSTPFVEHWFMRVIRKMLRVLCIKDRSISGRPCASPMGHAHRNPDRTPPAVGQKYPSRGR
jgi:hypothetical protein